MSIFDFVGLTVCSIFFIVFGISAILNFIHVIRYEFIHKWTWLPACVVIVWICYEGLLWVIYY